jgi:glycogen debranching enzyme
VSPGLFASTLLFSRGEEGRSYPCKFILNGQDWVCSSSLPQTRDSAGNTNNELKVQKSGFLPKASHDITPARVYLNKLHTLMAEEGFKEMYVHMASDDVMMIIRQNPNSLHSYVLITRTAFGPGGKEAVGDLRLPGELKAIELVSQLTVPHQQFTPDASFVNGLRGTLSMTRSLEPFANKTYLSKEGIDKLDFFDIPQAFICVLKVEPSNALKETLAHLNGVYSRLESFSSARALFAELTLEQVNHILWRCSAEEKDITANARDCYGVPSHRSFLFGGLGGLVAEFKPLVRENTIGHPIFDNLRAGPWLLDYHCARVTSYPLPNAYTEFFVKAFSALKTLPVGALAKHLVKLVFLLYRNLKLHVLHTLYAKGSAFQSAGDSFCDDLGLSATQLIGVVPSAHTHLTDWSISAGLPHFSVGFMRSWGRDTFIAFRGMLLVTGRFDEARAVLLTFASTMRHGLIPNLLDGGNNCRYNARDATWFFLQGLQDYVKMSDEGPAVLQAEVTMRFKSDHFEEHMRIREVVKLSLGSIVQQILQQHALGISFREWNAGTKIDAHMTDHGFDVNIGLNKQTGFVYGGNRWNCGTWMDKMGSSEKARNRGVPATPRDGAPVELTGLLYSTLVFLGELNAAGQFHAGGVRLQDSTQLSYREWAAIVKTNFESHYWIPPASGRVTGYYKDTVGGEIRGRDEQLRPNQCIAMAVAPELFERDNAVTALDVIERHLLPGIDSQQIGVRTLNKEDPMYKPIYDNSNDSTDPAVAHGFSYHNGPEWLWPLGYFIRAKLNFAGERNPQIAGRLMRSSRAFLSESLWMSLPELTNAEGNPCPFSCDSQAWSLGPLLEVFQDLA